MAGRVSVPKTNDKTKKDNDEINDDNYKEKGEYYGVVTDGMTPAQAMSTVAMAKVNHDIGVRETYFKMGGAVTDSINKFYKAFRDELNTK